MEINLHFKLTEKKCKWKFALTQRWDLTSIFHFNQISLFLDLLHQSVTLLSNCNTKKKNLKQTLHFKLTEKICKRKFALTLRPNLNFPFESNFLIFRFAITKCIIISKLQHKREKFKTDYILN